MTWDCGCGQVGLDLQAQGGDLVPDPEPDQEPDQEPVPEPAPPVVGLLESLRDAWTGEDSTDRAAAAAGVPRDLLESLDAAADQVARETRTPRRRS